MVQTILQKGGRMYITQVFHSGEQRATRAHDQVWFWTQVALFMYAAGADLDEIIHACSISNPGVEPTAHTVGQRGA